MNSSDFPSITTPRMASGGKARWKTRRVASRFVDGKRACLSCNESKTIECFSPYKHGIDGRRPTCKKCVREQHQKHYQANKERITAQMRQANKSPWRREWQRRYQKTRLLKMREASATRPRPHLCETCNKPNSQNRRLVWDHDHDTGQFRGWLCDRCNRLLGLARDDAEILRGLAAYLENARAKH